jgi:hypothetical protein
MRPLARRSLQPRPLVAVAHPLPPPLPTILNGRLVTPVAVARGNVRNPVRVARLVRMPVLLCL